MKSFLFLCLFSINGYAADIINDKNISLSDLAKQYCNINPGYIGERLCVKAVKSCLDSKTYFVELTPKEKAQAFFECIGIKPERE